MITIKNKAAIRKMEMAGQHLADIFEKIKEHVKPGVTTLELDAWIAEQLLAREMQSKTKGYKGYRHSSCISINDELVHGVPSRSSVIKHGDMVTIDICASWRDYCADMARTFFVGNEIPSEIARLIEAAERSLKAGIAMARPGNRLTDISAAVQQEVEQHGFGVVRDFAGHGIGKRMHEDPEILNYGAPGKGPVLRSGMTFAIEPMITMGEYEVYVADDGWTAKTVDKSLCAHVEDTVLITDGEPRVLTRPNG